MPITKENKQIPIQMIGKNNSNMGEIQELNQKLEAIIMVINNQANLLKEQKDRIGELYFKISKMDEQIQINKTLSRINRDRFKIFQQALIDLGLIDKDIFILTLQMMEKKMLPISSDGSINGMISLKRYNVPEQMRNHSKQRQVAQI